MLALGVPTVIDAFTIAIDLVSPLMKEFTAEEKSAFFMKIYKEGISDMYVHTEGDRYRCAEYKHSYIRGY